MVIQVITAEAWKIEDAVNTLNCVESVAAIVEVRKR